MNRQELHGRKPLISGNWKMNLNHLEAIQAIQKLSYALNSRDYDHVDVSVHPTFTSLRSVQTVLEADKVPISLGAQNVHADSSGAFTGEVSASMLSKLRVSYVIVGHSERRELYGETNIDVNEKTKAVLAEGMTPIVCVGESIEQRHSGQAQQTVEQQLLRGLATFDSEVVAGLVIAYEPVWAIGTGISATANDAAEMCGHIRSLVAQNWSSSAAEAVRIQYGGSVNPSNAVDLLAQADIDGALVGGASLKHEEFVRIVNFRLYQP